MTASVKRIYRTIYRPWPWVLLGSAAMLMAQAVIWSPLAIKGAVLGLAFVALIASAIVHRKQEDKFYSLTALTFEETMLYVAAVEKWGRIRPCRNLPWKQCFSVLPDKGLSMWFNIKGGSTKILSWSQIGTEVDDAR